MASSVIIGRPAHSVSRSLPHRMQPDRGRQSAGRISRRREYQTHQGRRL